MSTENKITREYEYEKNGKKFTIKRRYENIGLNNTKNNELDEFFKNNFEKLNDILDIKKWWNEYNQTTPNPVSYSMFYSKFRKTKEHYEKPNPFDRYMKAEEIFNEITDEIENLKKKKEEVAASKDYFENYKLTMEIEKLENKKAKLSQEKDRAEKAFKRTPPKIL